MYNFAEEETYTKAREMYETIWSIFPFPSAGTADLCRMAWNRGLITEEEFSFVVDWLCCFQLSSERAAYPNGRFKR